MLSYPYALFSGALGSHRHHVFRNCLSNVDLSKRQCRNIDGRNIHRPIKVPAEKVIPLPVSELAIFLHSDHDRRLACNSFSYIRTNDPDTSNPGGCSTWLRLGELARCSYSGPNIDPNRNAPEPIVRKHTLFYSRAGCGIDPLAYDTKQRIIGSPVSNTKRSTIERIFFRCTRVKSDLPAIAAQSIHWLTR